MSALALIAAAAFPGTATAHGPVAPVASSYLAKITSVPAGLDAKVVDGDQALWLQSPQADTVVVLDYRGAPYLRFTRAGVEVNTNSEMYYLNQTPVAETPPSSLTATTTPVWQHVTGAHHYLWHDGRLHALATVALAPGESYVGRWSIPISVDGTRSSISGGLFHASDASIVWFWPIVVLLACVAAAVRVRRPALEMLLARSVATAALVGTAAAAIGLELHGRPTVSSFQIVELAGFSLFVAWGLRAVLTRRPGWFTLFLIGAAALVAGLEVSPTLVDGFVLIALPAFVARTAAVLCLGCGVALLLQALRLVEQR
jgi:hypothetical protein